MRQEGDSAVLAERIAIFKSDPQKFREATEFVDELIQQAKKEAEAKQKERSKVERLGSESEQGNLKRRLGNRARGFIVRMFEALCNCSQSAAAAARTHTESLRASKR